MKRAQIMIVFVLIVVGFAFAQNMDNSSEVTPTVSQEISATGNNITGENGTTFTPIPTTTIHPSVTTEQPSTGNSGMTTGTVPSNFTSADTSSVEPTSTPSVPAVTTSVTTVSSTEWTSATTVCPPLSGFDGASFIGGIILALGVIVILVIIVKCYHHQSRKNELQYSQF